MALRSLNIHKNSIFHFTIFFPIFLDISFLSNLRQKIILHFLKNAPNFSLREQVSKWYQGVKFLSLLYDPPTNEKGAKQVVLNFSLSFFSFFFCVFFFRSALDARASSTITRVRWQPKKSRERRQKEKLRNITSDRAHAESERRTWTKTFFSFFCFVLTSCCDNCKYASEAFFLLVFLYHSGQSR
jgi:hypothetical protein